jgi:hypothetical protein
MPQDLRNFAIVHSQVLALYPKSVISGSATTRVYCNSDESTKPYIINTQEANIRSQNKNNNITPFLSAQNIQVSREYSSFIAIYNHLHWGFEFDVNSDKQQ